MSTDTSFGRIQGIIEAPGRVAEINSAFDGARAVAATPSSGSSEKETSIFGAGALFDFRNASVKENFNNFANQGGERVSFH